MKTSDCGEPMKEKEKKGKERPEKDVERAINKNSDGQDGEGGECKDVLPSTKGQN